MLLSSVFTMSCAREGKHCACVHCACVHVWGKLADGNTDEPQKGGGMVHWHRGLQQGEGRTQAHHRNQAAPCASARTLPGSCSSGTRQPLALKQKHAAHLHTRRVGVIRGDARERAHEQVVHPRRVVCFKGMRREWWRWFATWGVDTTAACPQVEGPWRGWQKHHIWNLRNLGGDPRGITPQIGASI